MIQETKLSKEEEEKLRKILGRWNVEMKESVGALGGMRIIWNTKIANIKIILSNNNWIGSVVSINKNNL